MMIPKCLVISSTKISWNHFLKKYCPSMHHIWLLRVIPLKMLRLLHLLITKGFICAYSINMWKSIHYLSYLIVCFYFLFILLKSWVINSLKKQEFVSITQTDQFHQLNENSLKQDKTFNSCYVSWSEFSHYLSLKIYCNFMFSYFFLLGSHLISNISFNRKQWM